MSHFSPSFTFTAPEELKLPEEYKIFLRERGIPFRETDGLTDGFSDADIIYMTRVQRERFTDPIEYERVKNVYSLSAAMLEGTKPGMKILHPLPRVNEISYDVDDSNHAYYFEQARNGVYTRMAIIAKLLGEK